MANDFSDLDLGPAVPAPPGAEAPGLANHSLQSATKFKLPKLEDIRAMLSIMSQLDLLNLRAEIDPLLEGVDFESLDLTKELMIQYRRATALQNVAMEDNSAPMNQQAQVLNSCSRILETITKNQVEAHNSQRQKSLEQALIKVLKDQPEELRENFYREFEKAVRAAST